MYNIEYTETDFNSILWTRQDFDQILQEQDEMRHKHNLAIRRAKNGLRCAAWFCLGLSLINIVYLNDGAMAIINLIMAVTCNLLILHHHLFLSFNLRTSKCTTLNIQKPILIRSFGQGRILTKSCKNKMKCAINITSQSDAQKMAYVAQLGFALVYR